MKRIATITSTAICLLCCLPQNGIAAVVSIDQLAKELSAQQRQTPVTTACIDIPTVDSEKSITNLVDTIREAEDSLGAARQFLSAFLKQINMQNGTSTSLEEACQLLRQNIDSVPVEYREIVYMGAEAIDMKSSEHFQSTTAYIEQTPFLLWAWDWFTKKPEKKVDYYEGIKNFTAKIGTKEIIAFAIIAATIAFVATKNPQAVGTVAQALGAAFQAML